MLKSDESSGEFRKKRLRDFFTSEEIAELNNDEPISPSLQKKLQTVLFVFTHMKQFESYEKEMFHQRRNNQKKVDCDENTKGLTI